MAAGYQMKGSIVFYLLMKYFALLTSRFRQYVFNWSLVIWRLCWHGRARIHPDIDVSKNAICTICRGWMAAGYQMKGNIVFYLLMEYFSLLTSRFRQYVFKWNLVIWRLCWHGRARIHPDIDVSKNAICTICRGLMAAGYQMKGNIVFYLLMKYVLILASRFSAIRLWLNSCHMGICWHDCSRIHPDVDVSKNAICTICRSWMAAGYQTKGNIVFYLLMKYLSLLTSRFSAICHQLKSCHLEAVWTWSFKNTSWYRCFQVRHMHNLPRLNGCGVSNERQYCFLSADEIFFTFNEPYFGNMSITEVLSFGGFVDMVVKVYILTSMFPRTQYAQSAAAEWLRGIKWKAILFSMCWWNMFHF